MRFISVRDLNTGPKQIWNKIKDEEVVITSMVNRSLSFQGLLKRRWKRPSEQSVVAALS
jgi:hypothetical protein